MRHFNQQNEKQIYENESIKLERDFFEGMKEGKTLDELKPILLKLKEVKLHLRNFSNDWQQAGR